MKEPSGAGLDSILSHGDFRFQMSLRKGDAGEFFRPSVDSDAVLSERRSWIEEAPGEAVILTEAGIPLVEAFSSSVLGGQVGESGGLEACRELGKQLEPDFLLLAPGADGDFKLEGGCVCFASSWRLAEKVGHSLDVVHQVVPGLNAALGRSIQAFLNRLVPEQPWFRYNWGLSRSSELNQHPYKKLRKLDSRVGVEDVWLRVEHQLLLRLDGTVPGILFCIRVNSYPLQDIVSNALICSKLIRLIDSMPEDVAIYKGIQPARIRLLEILRNEGL